MTIEQAAQELVDFLDTAGAKVTVGAGDISLYAYCETQKDKDL